MAEGTGTTSRVADALRAEITAGRLAPGEQLSEERVRVAHGVSRSTLREAFQLLIRERLLVHELGRGVFVRRLDRHDVADLYEVRRVLECGALRRITMLTPAGLRRLSDAVTSGLRAAEEREWEAVAAASIRFHEALVGLTGSERLEAMTSGMLAEFRLAYVQMKDTQAFHAGFLKRHVDIAEALRSGHIEEAADLLESYLRDSERAVMATFDA